MLVTPFFTNRSSTFPWFEIVYIIKDQRPVLVKVSIVIKSTETVMLQKYG